MLFVCLTENMKNVLLLYYTTVIFSIVVVAVVVSASHSVMESAGYILFHDNTLIPFNSIITVSKWLSTAEVGAGDLK